MQHVRDWCMFEQRVVKISETMQAEVYMRLDMTQLSEPFQINAVSTRDWNLSSEWERFNLLVPNEPPSAPSPTPATPPSNTPASTPPVSGSSSLSSDPGQRMSVGPSSSDVLLVPAR